MSLDRCIPDLVAQGKLTPEQGERAREVYGRRLRAARRTMGDEAAAAVAGEETVSALERDAAQAKRQALLQVSAQKRILGDLAGFDGGSGKRAGAAAMALFDHDARATYTNVAARKKAIVGRAHAMAEGILHRHSRTIVGTVRNKADLVDLVRAAFGEETDNVSARELAEAWGQTADMLRQRFNAAGGAIGRLERWGLPQMHDSLLVRRAGYEAWRAAILPRLDVAAMRDGATGLAFDAEGLEAALQDAFATIRTDGWIKRAPGGHGGAAKLANRRADPRFFVFKSADDWMAYSNEFGGGSPFDAMMGHIEGMARDIAHMEVLGPNPAATVRWVKDGLMKGAALEASGSGIDGARHGALRVQQMFDTTSGALSAPVHGQVARQLGSVRAYLTSAMLGSASLSAGTDMGFQAVTRAFNGLPVAGAITGYLKLLNPAARADRRLAVRMGLIAEEAAKMGSAQNRYLGEVITGEWSRRLAEGVLRASGLSVWTQAGRWAFGMEFLGHLADEAGKPLDRLDGPLARALGRYGFDADRWDTLRATPLLDHEGATFLDPGAVEDRELGDRLLEMVLTETDFAVPAATVRARSLMTIGQPGSFAAEMARSIGLFKSFGVSMVLTHGLRMMSQQAWGKARYAAGLVVTTTLLGAAAMQMKEIAKGRDPSPTDHPAFWGRAILQGGGLGVFGDLIGQVTQPRIDSVAAGLGGPVAGLVGDVGLATFGNAAKAAPALWGERPKGLNPGRDAVKLAKRYTPGSSLWWLRAAFERMVLDQIQDQIDPKARDARRRLVAQAKANGQHYFWEPGHPLPDRAPDLANALKHPP